MEPSRRVRPIAAWPGRAALLAAGLLSGCASLGPWLGIAEDRAADSAVRHAWVQAGAERGWVARAISVGETCPTLWVDGRALPMATRIAPGVVALRASPSQPEARDSSFSGRSCEAPVPAGASSLRVGSRELPVPRPDVRRIVMVADTGCRMKQSESAFQDCNDPAAWPWAAVARQAAATRPDLVIHLGDLHYRESPCPAGRAGCAGSPWGYGDDAWEADFFNPAAPLLAAAPWLLVRGNHESCARAGVGWFRYLDARPWSTTQSCEDARNDEQGDFSEPWAWPLTRDTQVIVFDSSIVANRPYAQDDLAYLRFAEQLATSDRLAAGAPHNFFLNHHPVLAFAGSANGAPRPGTRGLLSVMQARHPERLFPEGVDAVLTGHVHLFEALDFSSGHPAALVFGNAGSAMEGTLDADAARAAQPAPGARVREFATQPGFGFATLDRRADGWRLTEYDVQGRTLKFCSLNGSRLDCATTP